MGPVTAGSRRAARLCLAAAIALLVSVLAGCGGSDSSGESAGSSLSTGGFPPPEVSAPRTMASRSVLEPDSVAGIPLGATKDQAQAVLGPATVITQERDSAGRYEVLRWQLTGNRGLVLSFRSGSTYSPGLTDWQTNIAGPKTAAGVEVGNPTDLVVAAYGPLADFCCRSRVGVLERGGGRLVVTVPDGTGAAESIIGGDPQAWMRSVED